MPNNDFVVYSQDTSEDLTHSQYQDAITAYTDGTRNLAFPSNFQQEITDISNGLQSSSKGSFQAFFQKGLSFTAAYSFNYALIMLAQIQFGPGPISAYYIYGSTGSFARALIKTLSELTFHGPLKNTAPLRSNINPIAFHFSRFLINLTNSLTAVFPLESFSLQTICPLAKSSLIRVSYGYIDYIETLSQSNILESMRGPILFPGKTCFTQNGHNNYIDTILDRRVLTHFKNSLRRFSRIIDEELPVEVIKHGSLSWIQKSIHAIRRFVEPLTIPYHIAIQYGEYNPYHHVIKTTSISARTHIQKTQEDLEAHSHLEHSLILSAKDLFHAFQSGYCSNVPTSTYLSQLNRQSETITRQESEIQRLQTLLNHHLNGASAHEQNDAPEPSIHAYAISPVLDSATYIQEVEAIDYHESPPIRSTFTSNSERPTR